MNKANNVTQPKVGGAYWSQREPPLWLWIVSIYIIIYNLFKLRDKMSKFAANYGAGPLVFSSNSLNIK